jgi:hypothetical protein
MTVNMRVGEPPDPFSNPEISGIHNPQHLRSLTQGVVLGVFQPVVMDIYTGCCVFEYGGDRDPLISLVPLGLHGQGPDVDIQSYPGVPGSGTVEAIISASMTSFGDDPDGAAVDGAVMKLETHSFPGFPPANVLVIHAELGANGGNLYRLAYQVTVFAQTRENGLELPSMVVAVDPNQEVPTN